MAQTGPRRYGCTRMTRYQRHHWFLAVALAALAGFVDAIGFLYTGGFFTAFMTGNSTRMAVGLFTDGRIAAIAASMIATFVLGVIIGNIAGRLCPARNRLPLTILGVVVLLAAAAGLGMAGLGTLAVGFTLLAMGMENTVFQREGQVSIGLTYMTGTLVKLGQALSRIHHAGQLWAWVPHLLLWAGLVGGAGLGVLAYLDWGLLALWIAAGIGLALALVASLPRFALDE
jgi:uncharacterized membrane protein YoaK (UPF0700 family)